MKMICYLRILLYTFCLFAISEATYAQIKVTGKVSSAGTGEALIGANVTVKGTTVGVMTDTKGDYVIEIPNATATLVISYVGYLNEEVAVANRQSIDVVLIESIEKLNEVVVVGYGTQKRLSVTGAISTVSGEVINQAPVDNVTGMIAGRIAGVISRQTSGAPGDNDSKLYIRGLSTTGTTTPLIIVDGVEREFKNLDPGEIENVSILKDASSASVYGVKGANGVILVTTKRGSKTEKTTIAYKTTYGLSYNTEFPKLLDGVDYAYYYNKALALDGKADLYTTSDIAKIKANNDPTGAFGNTDWVNALFEKFGTSMYHNLSVTGGNDKVKYYVMGGYFNQKGIISKITFDRYNLRSNVDAKVTADLSLSVDIAARQEERKAPAIGYNPSDFLNLVEQAIFAKPTIAMHDSAGNDMASNIGWGNVNPIVSRDKSGYSKSSMSVFQSSVTLKYTIPYVKGLALKFMASYDKDYTFSKTWLTPSKVKVFNEGTRQITDQWASYQSDGTNQLTESFDNKRQITLQPSISYEKQIGSHTFKAIAVYEQADVTQNKFGAAKKNFSLTDLQELSLATDVLANSVTGSSSETARAGYVGRIDYDYKNKYLLQVSSRYDGSYRFQKAKRWGFFPSASVGYRLSEEEFFKSALPFVNNLKIRASAGKMGNDQTDAFKYLRYMNMNSTAVVLGGTVNSALYTGDIPNYNLTWESATSYDAGLDATIWNGLLDIEFDWFYKTTHHILQNYTGIIPPSLGGNYPSLVNAGIVDNRGFELTLKHTNRITRDLTLNLGANITATKNKFIQTDDSPNIPDYQKKSGHSMGGSLGFIAEGLFQSEDEIKNSALLDPNVRPGDIKYKDLNGDGRITYDQDRTWIGKSNIPEIVYGFSCDVKYKIFDLSVLFQGAAKTDIALSGTYANTGGIEDNTAYTRLFYNGGNAPYYMAENSWTPTHTNAKYTRLTTEYVDNNAYASTFWMRDASYLRLKNIQFGIEIPKSILSRFKIEGLRIYFTGSNLVTWTNLEYIDPETPDVQNGYYPQQKSYNMGLNLTF